MSISVQPEKPKTPVFLSAGVVEEPKVVPVQRAEVNGPVFSAQKD